MKNCFLWLLLCAAMNLSATAQSAEFHDAPSEAVCGLDFQAIAMHPGVPAGAIYANTRANALARAHDVVLRLTFEEKLALTGGVKQFYFPGVSRLGIPSVYFADATQGIHEKEICIKIEKSTAFPDGQALAATWDTSLAYDYAKAISEECRAWGVSVLLGPGLNLYRNSEGGRDFEYFGEDPMLASRLGVSYVRGMQSGGTIATAKHFLGNEQEFIRHDADVQISERALRELYLPPFRAAIVEGGALAVMTGNNYVNGHPGSADTPLSMGVLRHEYGFHGSIMSDWANSMFYPTQQEQILNSGHTLLMENNDLFAKWVKNEILAHPDKKKEIEASLDKMVEANLYTFFKAGVYDRPLRDPSLVTKIDSHNAVALRTAEESITLLKNDASILPLDPRKNQTIAVVGTDEALTVYGGRGSGAVKGYDHVDFMTGLKVVYGEKVNVVPMTDEAAIHSADIVLYFINKRASESVDFPFIIDGIDASIGKLAALNPNIIVIFSGGNGFAMPWLSKVKGLLFAYLEGQQRGTALADILCGKVNPSGKLPFTIEKTFDDSPAHDFNKLPDGSYSWGGGRGDSMKAQAKFGLVPVKYSEGIYIGYRWYDKKNIAVQFPFGYGMSYTSFAYTAAKPSARTLTNDAPINIALTVKNTGKREGAEIAQMYIHPLNTSIDRPIKELKGFARVSLHAGESRTITLPLRANDLARWDDVTHNWKVDHGQYEVEIGSSSADIHSHAIIEY